MAITAPDIKLLESERMADTTDGGGRRTSRVIQDGVAGNIFPKVSRLDSVYGRVNLRKVFGAVQTAGVDTYAGAHAVITDAPNNPNIHTTLFSTSSDFDDRSTARDRIESYVTSGPESRMVLLGRQLAGQQSIVCYQREEEPLPEVGEVFCLTTESGGFTSASQYFRAATVTSEVRTFTEPLGSAFTDFKRRVVTIGTGTPLRYEFNGPDSASQSSSVERPSRIRLTNVVDAARYFGIKKLAAPAASGDLTVSVSSVYSPIVPTTNRETPLANAEMGLAAAITPAASAPITENIFVNFTVGRTLYLSRPITPGSLSLACLSFQLGTLTDDQGGNLGVGTPYIQATVDYENGTITLTSGSPTITGNTFTYAISYVPAAATSQTAHTIDTPITLANRGTVHVFSLHPIPAPGTTYIDYRALGKWYRLRDDGTGALSGSDPAYGVGSVDYVSGNVVLTLGALPDVGSSILVGWGSGAHYTIHSGSASTVGGEVRQTVILPNTPVAPDSVTLSFVSGGTTYTVSDNASGVLSGSGVTGSVEYTTGRVELEFTTHAPDAGTPPAFSYSSLQSTVIGSPAAHSVSLPASATNTLSTSISPGSLTGSVPMAGAGFTGNVTIRDNGAGLLVAPGGQKLNSYGSNKDAVINSDQIIGTVNYATGALNINTGVNFSYQAYTPIVIAPWATGFAAHDAAPSWSAATGTATVGSSTANYGWQDSGVATTTTARTFTASYETSPLRIALTNGIGERLVPGSLRFSVGAMDFIDRNGILYYGVSGTNGSGTIGGSVDYATGFASITAAVTAAPSSITVSSCLTSRGEAGTAAVFFRTAGAPIRPGSFYLQAVAEDGTVISATSNDSGTLTGANVTGTVDQQTGVVRAAFGQFVTAAGHESEWWYDAADVSGGQIFMPKPVIPSTLQYNAVILANLPLNADLLGLDPVRLPADGRVPIYKAADVVVVHNTDTTTLPSNVTAGSTHNVGRANLSEVWLTDQHGAKIPADQYVYSLVNGTVTMASALALSAYTQPLVANHRVEDLALLSDVQINGQLTLSAPLSRAYNAESYVSSAILFGDMNARVEGVHDLSSFAAWSATGGPQANAQYDDIDFPIEVLNNGAITEKWRVSFTTSTTFQVIGENLGAIATGNTSTDCAPSNLLTGNPYFAIRSGGWGSGWAAGNQLRFNTIGAAAPIWIARTVLPGATLEGDSFSLQMRGDVDA